MTTGGIVVFVVVGIVWVTFVWSLLSGDLSKKENDKNLTKEQKSDSSV